MEVHDMRLEIIAKCVSAWVNTAIVNAPKRAAAKGCAWVYVIKARGHSEGWLLFTGEEADSLRGEYVNFGAGRPTPLQIDAKLTAHAMTKWMPRGEG